MKHTKSLESFRSHTDPHKDKLQHSKHKTHVKKWGFDMYITKTTPIAVVAHNTQSIKVSSSVTRFKFS